MLRNIPRDYFYEIIPRLKETFSNHKGGDTEPLMTRTLFTVESRVESWKVDGRRKASCLWCFRYRVPGGKLPNPPGSFRGVREKL